MAARPIKLKLLPRSTMKVKVATRLVGQVLAGDGVTVTKAAGNFIVSSEVSNLSFPPTLAEGDLLVADSDSSLASLPASTDGYALIANGTGTSPSYQGFLQSGTGAAARTWRSKGRDIVSVKDYDGVTGNGIANDTTGLQAAIDSGAKVLVWPEGTYVTDTLTLVANQAWIGAGKGKTTIKLLLGFGPGSGILLNAASVTTKSRNVIDGFTLDCDNKTSGIALYAEYVDNWVVRNCDIKNHAGWGIYVGTTPGSDTVIRNGNITIEGCDFSHHTSTYEFILVFNSANVTVRRCTFSDAPSGFGVGVFQITSSVLIEDCYFTGCSAGIYYEVSCDDTTIRDCKFTGNTTDIKGANIGDNGGFGFTVATNLHIENCTFEDSAGALELGALRGGTVSNCLFQRIEGTAVAVDNGNFTSAACSDIAFKGCRFIDNNSLGGPAILGPAVLFLAIGASNITFEDCDFFDTQVSQTQSYPIVFYGGLTWQDISFTNCRMSSYGGATSIGVSAASVGVTGAANNGSGLIRIATSNTDGMYTGTSWTISGVVGTTEANGSWTITVIDETHFDLQGSTFTNAYVSGGLATSTTPTLTNVSLLNCRDVSASLPSGVKTFTSSSAGWKTNTALLPLINDGATVGSATLSFSDVFLAEGGTINWDNGDVVITQTNNILTFSGATTRYEFDAVLTPTVADGAALGTAAMPWSDADFASGAVIRFNNSFTVTHSAGLLTLSGALAGTTWNKVTITAPATSATLTIADGKTATHNATTTFAGTDGKTLTISNSGTLSGGDAWTLSIAASKSLTVSNTLTLTGTDSSSIAFGAGGTIGAVGYATTGQIPGTATNDSATAGKIGEFVEAVSGASGTVTITIASPAVITFVGHSFTGIAAVVFSTTGALPTGITAGTTYYTLAGTVAGSPFNIATSTTNALAGTAINTSGSQSGVQTISPIVGLSTGVTIDMGAISLTAGEWDILLAADLNPASTTVNANTDISIGDASATRPGGQFRLTRLPPMTGTGQSLTVHAGPHRVTIAGTTSYFAIVRANFSVSTFNFQGMHMRARRVR